MHMHKQLMLCLHPAVLPICITAAKYMILASRYIGTEVHIL